MVLQTMSILQTVRHLDLGDMTIREVASSGAAYVPRHAHDHAHLSIITSGVVTDKTIGSSEVLAAGDVVFHPANHVHENVVADPGSSGIVIDLDDHFLTAFTELPGTLERSMRTTSALLHGLPHRITREIKFSDDVTPFVVRGLIMEILALGARAMLSTSSQKTRAAQPPAWLQNAMGYIDERYMHSIQLTAVASRTGVSPAKLRRGLRQWYNRTFPEVLRERRIEAALQLLGSDVPLRVIALECGFYDQAHFTRVFRTMRGVSPNRHRQSLVN
jgi:AraC family transcriptional regulator